MIIDGLIRYTVTVNGDPNKSRCAKNMFLGSGNSFREPVAARDKDSMRRRIAASYDVM